MDKSRGKRIRRVDAFLPNYIIGKTLGMGSFGKVKIAQHAYTGHTVAIKILDRRKIEKEKMEEKVTREIKISKLLVHPHVVRLYEVIETATYIYMVLEYAKRGELYEYILDKGTLQEDEALKLFQQIISGLEYCHENMVVHRDLKAENILLDANGNVKIIDFGLSNIMQPGHLLKTSCGSLNYAAPEVICNKSYGCEVDVWSCGVILYALLCGTLPFDDENIPILNEKIKAGRYPRPSHISVGARDLIQRILVVDPLKRITIPQIRQHPWFRTHVPRHWQSPMPHTYIDEGILREVVMLGFDPNHLIESLRRQIQNEATVAYYLLMDNRVRPTSGHVGANFQEPRECGSPGMHPGEVASSAVVHQRPTYAVPQIDLNTQLPVERKWALGLEECAFSGTDPSQVAASSIVNQLPACMNSNIDLRPQLPVEKNWDLGLLTRAHSSQILIDVLDTLKEMNVAWKMIGRYNMKCRWYHGLPDSSDGMVKNPGQDNHLSANGSAIYESDGGGSGSPGVVKFEVQLYKNQDEKHLLDLKRVHGPKLLFLDLCSAFRARLN